MNIFATDLLNVNKQKLDGEQDSWKNVSKFFLTVAISCSSGYSIISNTHLHPDIDTHAHSPKSRPNLFELLISSYSIEKLLLFSKLSN